MHTSTDALGQAGPELVDLLEHLPALGVVGHRRHVRAREDQIRLVILGVDVLGERFDHAGRILEPVPARDLCEHRDVEPQLSLLDHLGLGLHPSDAAVEPLE